MSTSLSPFQRPKAAGGRRGCLGPADLSLCRRTFVLWAGMRKAHRFYWKMVEVLSHEEASYWVRNIDGEHPYRRMHRSSKDRRCDSEGAGWFYAGGGGGYRCSNCCPK